MLPFNHLPRNGGDHISSDNATPAPPDAVLELLSPLLSAGPSSEAGPSSWTTAQVKGVREKLQGAVVQNKKRRHELLLSQFANISSHIQRGEQLQQDHTRISESLKRLSAELGTSDASTSFLGPTVAAVERHFSALHRRDAARARVKALHLLQRRAKEVERLEEAVWTGRGADDWVIERLKQSPEEGYTVDEGWEVVRGTSAMRDITARHTLLKGMVVEQVTDAFAKAVTFTSSPGGINVQDGVRLPLPRIPRSGHPPDSSKATSPPPYPLQHIYTTLHSFSALSPLLKNLQDRLLKELILPLLHKPPHYKLSSTKSDHSASLNLISTEARNPADILSDVSILLDFIASSMFPSTSSDLLESRTAYLRDLHAAIWQAVLQNLIIPSTPASLGGVRAWLDLLHRSSEAESASLPDGSAGNTGVISKFADREAGSRWANGRRHRVADEVRKLIFGGWGGWESMEVAVEKEVTVVIEVEVDEPPEAPKVSIEGSGDKDSKDDGEADFGWGFDDPPEKSTEAAVIEARGGESANGHSAEPTPADSAEEEEGWGFGEEDKPATPPPPKGDNPPTASDSADAEDEGEGWDFDLPDPSSTAAMPPPPAPIAKAPQKPVREAKKLGKAVAKAKAAAEETASEVSDDWGSDAGTSHARRDSVFSESSSATPGGVAGMLDTLLGEGMKMVRSGSQSTHSRQASVSAPSQPPIQAEEDGWGWEEPAAVVPPSSSLTRQSGVDPGINALAAKQVARKRVERREEKRVVKEKMMISRACTKLLEIAERVIHETEELHTSSFPESFSSAEDIIRQSLKDAFDLYRALITTHYAAQLQEVPVLAMQVANDHSHLATSLDQLASSSHLTSQWGVVDVLTRLRGAGEGVYETFLEVQRDSLLATLEEGHVAHVATEGGFKGAERAVKQVVHNLESLGRVLKPVITASTYFPTLGYLLDCVLFYLTGEILAMGDITEMESTRLNELLNMLHPLEELFTDASGQVRVVEYVKGWLRFCYISELLVANLVDITYLFDTGALVDFTAEELTGLIRALFADSPKRDAAIDRITIGLAAQAN